MYSMHLWKIFRLLEITQLSLYRVHYSSIQTSITSLESTNDYYNPRKSGVPFDGFVGT